ncbi:MAG: hypothetical protein Q8O57_03050 [Kiritimatiellota bacterium]|nr:hypothetical protein [Kiritimatiellota bacterium]
MSPFAYVEPTIEELNRRIAAGQAFIQSTMGPAGEYEEYYQPTTPVPTAVVPPELRGLYDPAWAAEAPALGPLERLERWMGGVAGTETGTVSLASVMPGIAGVSGVAGILKALPSVAQIAPKVPAVLAGAGTLLAGGGAGALLAALGVGGAAAGLLGLAGQLLPGAAGWLTGAGINGNGGGVMTTGQQIVTGRTALNGVPFGGPGVPEPPAGMVSKAWKTKSFSNVAGEYWVYHWSLLDGRRLTWNAAKNQAKIWRPQKNITLGPKPRVKDLIRINRQIDRLNRGLKKQLKRAHVDLS